MVGRCRGILGRQGGADERCVGTPNDFARFELCGSFQGDVLKSGRNEKDSELQESHARQRIYEVVTCDCQEDNSAHYGDLKT